CARERIRKTAERGPIMTEETIFAEASAKTDPAERATFLNQACAGDAALRQRLEALLGSHEGAGSFMNIPAVDVAAANGDQRTGTEETLTGPGGPIHPDGSV